MKTFTQRIAAVGSSLLGGAMLSGALCGALQDQAFANSSSEAEYDTPAAIQRGFQEGRQLLARGDNYGAAAMFFNVYTAPGASQGSATALLAESLIRGGYPNAASYFYIKTLQSDNHAAIRHILPYLPQVIDAVGGDLLRKYILGHTSEADYDANTRNHFFYFLGKDELLKGDAARALQALSRVTSGSGVLASAAYLKGTAYAMTGQINNAIASFKSCQRMSGDSSKRSRSFRHEPEDLEARCTAGLARSYYQAGDYRKAEETYDEIPKASFVWTDILFEQAWNAYAKGDFNRSLGKLVTYRSPSLDFVFNPEVDVLRAQSFLSLCIYDDVNKTVNEFNARYAGIGNQMKNLLVSNDKNFRAFYAIAKQAYHSKLHTGNTLSKALNRFIRGPYFTSLISQERAVQQEGARLRAARSHERFAAFLEKVVDWRASSVRLLGGLFVRNSLYDLYQDLLADLDKMSFIKLEMLKRTKTSLEKKQGLSADDDGMMKSGTADVERRDYQYFWTFNGEFWADELGDYVFALESQCGS